MEISMTLKVAKEERGHIIEAIQEYFRTERDEEIGQLAAEFLLDFMVEQVGPFLYNQAIDEVQKVFNQKMAALEEDFYALKRPVKR
jgi:uncharacterized protein (DUF2164 family)